MVSIERRDDVVSLQDRLESLYRASAVEVFNYARNRSSEDIAREVVAQTYLEAWRTISTRPEREITVGWLITVARNLLIDRWRKGARRQALDHLALEEPRAAVDIAGAIAERDEVVRVLDELPLRQRSLLVLHHVDGLSTRELAARSGSTIRATESALARARRSFRRIYEETDHG